MARRQAQRGGRSDGRHLPREALLADERRRFPVPAYRRSDRLFILAYPNTYWIGMSNLGYQVVRRAVETTDGWRVERAFHAEPEGRQGPRTLESAAPLTAAAVLGFALATELDGPHLARMLFEAGIPVLAARRTESDPVVLLGGAAPTLNPEPYAPLADAVLVGESEHTLAALLEVLGGSGDRQTRLERAASIGGVYVPSLYEPRPAGPWESPAAVRPSLPYPVGSPCLTDLDVAETASDIVSPHTEFGDVRLIEIARGCSRGCRFCVVGPAYGRARFRGVASVLALAEGERRIGLLGAAAADHPHLAEMVTALREAGHEVTLSASRVEVLRPAVLAELARAGQRTLTVAPETVDDAVRERIGKGISLERVRSVAATAEEVGFTTLKLYFMLGLPGSGDDEPEAIAGFVEELRGTCRRLRLAVSAGPFVPKPQTPLERAPFAPRAVLRSRIRALEARLRRLGSRVEPRLGSARHAELETVLSRGDRRAGRALAALAAEREPSLGRIERALEEAGLPIEPLLGEIPPDAPLPWAIVRREGTVV